MSDQPLRQFWLADQLRAQTANALAYPIAPADRECFAQLRGLAKELMSQALTLDASSIHRAIDADEGLRTPLWAMAFPTTTRDGHSRLYWEYLPTKPDFDQYVNHWRERLRATNHPTVSAIADSYALGLAIPHTYIGWCPVTSRASAAELDATVSATSDAVTHALQSFTASAAPHLRERASVIPSQLPAEAVRVCRDIARACQAGLADSDDSFNRERYEYFQDVCAQLAVGAHGAEPVAGSFLDAVSPTTGAEAAITDERGRILLMQRTDTGQWAMPGGACEVGETPAMTAVREANEEIGVDVRVEALSSVVDNRLITDEPVSIGLIAVYACRLSDSRQRPTSSSEAMRAQWFSRSELSGLDFFHGHGVKIRSFLDSGEVAT